MRDAEGRAVSSDESSMDIGDGAESMPKTQTNTSTFLEWFSGSEGVSSALPKLFPVLLSRVLPPAHLRALPPLLPLSFLFSAPATSNIAAVLPFYLRE